MKLESVATLHDKSGVTIESKSIPYGINSTHFLSFNMSGAIPFESRLPNKLFSLSLNSISLLTCEVSSLVLVYSIGSLKFSYVSNTETCDISSQSSSITSCLYIFW